MFAKGDIISNARIVQIDEEFAWFDIGAKFESPVPLSDWRVDEDPPQIGDKTEVMIDDDVDVDDRPLDIVRIERHVVPRLPSVAFFERCIVGQTYSGEITHRFEDGFVVNIGVPVFLPNERAEPAMLENPKACIGQEREFRIAKIIPDKRQIQVELA